MNVRGKTSQLPTLAATAHAAITPTRFQKWSGGVPARSASTRLTPTSARNDVTISGAEAEPERIVLEVGGDDAVEPQVEGEVIGEHQAERAAAQRVDAGDTTRCCGPLRRDSRRRCRRAGAPGGAPPAHRGPTR